MELPSILRQNKSQGFTLVELIITLGILATVFAFGLFISFDFYKNYSFHSEKSTIVSVLQKARGQALNNINQSKHGVHFENTPGLKYIIFEGDTFDADADSNIVINASYNISITSPPLPFDVIFEQLTGNSADQTITVGDGVKSYDISINSFGRIDWQ